MVDDGKPRDGTKTVPSSDHGTVCRHASSDFYGTSRSLQLAQHTFIGICRRDYDYRGYAGVIAGGISRRFELERASSQMGCEFDLVSARQIASFIDPRYKDLLFESEAARDAIRSHVLGHFADEIMDENENEILETAMDFLFQTALKQTSGESQF